MLRCGNQDIPAYHNRKRSRLPHECPARLSIMIFVFYRPRWLLKKSSAISVQISSVLQLKSTVMKTIGFLTLISLPVTVCPL